MGKRLSCYHLWEEEYENIMSLIIQLFERQMPKGPQRDYPLAKATSSPWKHPCRANWGERISSKRAAFKIPKPNRHDRKNFPEQFILLIFLWGYLCSFLPPWKKISLYITWSRYKTTYITYTSTFFNETSGLCSSFFSSSFLFNFFLFDFFAFRRKSNTVFTGF